MSPLESITDGGDKVRWTVRGLLLLLLTAGDGEGGIGSGRCCCCCFCWIENS
jgi:hypothetical protein